jgi:hypothetical protein
VILGLILSYSELNSINDLYPNQNQLVVMSSDAFLNLGARKSISLRGLQLSSDFGSIYQIMAEFEKKDRIAGPV